MAILKKTKASDLQGLCKKLVTLLKKHYKPAGHKKDRSVLETMLYAVCLENSTQEQADAAYDRLHSIFNDMNEIRVSTYYELTPVFDDWELALWFGRGNSSLSGAVPAEKLATSLYDVWQAARIDRFIAVGL